MTTIHEARQETIRNPSGYGKPCAIASSILLGVLTYTSSSLIAPTKIGQYRGGRYY